MGEENDIDDLGNVVTLNTAKDTSKNKKVLVPTEIIEQLSGFLNEEETPAPEAVTDEEWREGHVIPFAAKNRGASSAVTGQHELKLPLPIPIPIPGREQPEPPEFVQPVLTPTEEMEREEKLQELAAFAADHFAKYRPPTLKEYVAEQEAKKNAPKDLLHHEKVSLKEAKNALIGTFTRSALHIQNESEGYEKRAEAREDTKKVFQAFRQLDQNKKLTSTQRAAAKSLDATNIIKEYREYSLKLNNLSVLENKIAPLKERVVSGTEDGLIDKILSRSSKAIVYKGPRKVNDKQSMFLCDALDLVSRGEYLPNRPMERAIKTLDVDLEFSEYRIHRSDLRKEYSDPLAEFNMMLEDIMHIREYSSTFSGFGSQKNRLRADIIRRGGLERKEKILEEEVESALSTKREEEQKILLQRAGAIPQLAGEHKMYVRMFFGTVAHKLEENMYERARVMGDVTEENFAEKAKPELYKATDDTAQQLYDSIPDFCDKIEGAVKMTVYALMIDYITNIDRHRRRIRRMPGRRLG